jgi:PhnB protein
MATVQLSPYLHFHGDCEQAMEFYRSVFGGEVTYMRFKEMPPMPGFENMAEQIMHAELTTPEVSILASDSTDDGGIRNFQMALSGTDGEKLRSLFSSLAQGGEIGEPLEKAPWGDEFGMLTDKFGVKWMVNIASK